MKLGRFKGTFVFGLLVSACLAVGGYAQSTDQQFPTPVRTNEIVGAIKARDVGDSRLTTYYYTFEGEQGDLFINVQSKNFTGDVDVYMMTGLRPLTKIVTYADVAESETGRVIYLRKPERILLRVQGRTPGDEEATFRIKFAGSFAASKLEGPTASNLPKAVAEADTGIKVNSVGTIIEAVPKVTPTPDAVAERTEEERKEEPVKETKEPEAAKEEAPAGEKKLEVVVTDPTTAVKTPARRAPTTASRRNRRARTTPAKPEPTAKTDPGETPAEKTDTPAKPTTTGARRSRRAAAAPKTAEPKVDPMANIRLVITFKDGSTVERPMSEVMRFSVERAVLTVINKNGTIGRYQMTEVARVSIE